MKKGLIVFLSMCVMVTFCLVPVSAKEETSKNIEVSNASELEEAVSGSKEKTITITKDINLPGTLYVGNNTTIIATGKTIKCNNGAARNEKMNKANYSSAENISIVGGTWKSNYSLSLFQFVHAKNISFKNAKITCGVKGHAIELIACKNVKINKCNIKSVGKAPKTSVEEMVQIDLATPRTAPTVPNKLRKGQTCKNVSITNSTVSGARAVCSNYASVEKKYKNRFHQNIKVQKCKLTGLTSEALALFNAVNLNVSNNTIKTKSKRTGSPYSVGCHVHMFGKLSVKGNKNVVIKKNKVYGGRQAILIYSHSSSRYGKAVVKGNKAYCKAGAGNAIKVDGVKSKAVGGNKTFKW